MEFRRLLPILALLLCESAPADIFTVVDFVETSTANINVPTSTNGRLTFKPCADPCKAAFISIRLTPETEFIVRGKNFRFADFRRVFYELRRSEDDYALVSYDTEKKTVKSVRIGI